MAKRGCLSIACVVVALAQPAGAADKNAVPEIVHEPVEQLERLQGSSGEVRRYTDTGYEVSTLDVSRKRARSYRYIQELKQERIEEQLHLDSMEVLDETIMDGDEGRFSRFRLLRADAIEGGKYPRIRVEELWQRGIDDERLVRRDISIAQRYIVSTETGLDSTSFEQALESLGATVVRQVARRPIYVISIEGDITALPPAQVSDIAALAGVRYVDTDYLVRPTGEPNDPLFSQQWHLNNTGITGGTEDADIDALEAWDSSFCSQSQIVAVIDTGVDYRHEDLARSIWTNSGEAGPLATNGIDDDGNGYVDDVHGWDFFDRDGDPTDGGLHGTHVAGILGAAGNNATGLSGVCQTVRMMVLRFLGSSGGATSDAIEAVYYANDNGAKLTNNSWGGGGRVRALEDAITNSLEHDSLFVAAAGNNGRDIDQTPFYPASYQNTNVVAVASTDHNDRLSSFSNWGTLSVDVGAPGEAILATLPTAFNRYGLLSGTSMAAPVASGLLTLIRNRFTELTALEAKARMMTTVDPVGDLAGKVVTGGRVNARSGIETIPTSPGETPIGTIVAFAGTAEMAETLYPDWKLCSFTTPALRISEYPQLFLAIGYSWTANPGADSMRFNVPVLDRVFLRGVDHNPLNSDRKDVDRQPMGDKEKWQAGSFQWEGMRNHTHGGSTGGSSSGERADTHEGSGNHSLTGHVHSIESNPSVVNDRSETRPTNVYINWLIRAR